MHPTKTPGLDGLQTLFYHNYWSIVGRDVLKVALDILNNQRDPSDINSTFIALIPKKKKPTLAQEFRPISLCNVIMKAVTKAISNRLKAILPDIISEEHSAFVKDRFITDNALIAMECFYWMKNKKRGKNGTMALKFDMSKEYDRIKWDFMEGVLNALEFPAEFVQLTKKCLSTISYQILLNGQPSRKFAPQRGLRQGEPLSPFIFIMCADVLVGLLKGEADLSSVHGIQVSRKALVITYMFFADDSLLFARANKDEADIILKILERYQ